MPPVARRASSEAKDILLYYGINPYWDRENLAFGQNFEHTLASIRHMDGELVTLAADPQTTKATIAAKLKGFADLWIIHQLPGMAPGK